MGLEGSRIARKTGEPNEAAVRAAAEPTAPVGPKTMTLGELILRVWIWRFVGGACMDGKANGLGESGDGLVF